MGCSGDYSVKTNKEKIRSSKMNIKFRNNINEQHDSDVQINITVQDKKEKIEKQIPKNEQSEENKLINIKNKRR